MSPTGTTPLTGIAAFLSAFARRQAARTVELPGGFVALDDRYVHSRANNQAFVDGPLDPGGPAALPGRLDQALAHLPYRMVTVLDDATGRACAPYLTAAGYAHHTYVVMIHEAPVPPAAAAAAPVALAELREALAGSWRGFLPHATEEEIGHLVDRREARLRGAEQVRFVAARTPDGQIASWADLYTDPAAGIAQIEDLVTAEAHLGRGHATAVLHTALHLAADLPVRFLIADAHDWPRHWYARHGFTPAGHLHHFDRA
ncbi:GNAT family N-acetyltransferase [Streptomyces antimicrobicus]|uniref:GNAT family N-acetyltransferase n=1 Tax=Streptomyces antimicrobicus TaxID=2883108 RepID=A0ABS8BDL0_9ACTN|nr:GNAT family N-acetyltransferase [Streptomyces antimicrobicus]MCB5182732.1 GNAT family N-acetyltransferase [Streptomyces antimicrobicus]